MEVHLLKNILPRHITCVSAEMALDGLTVAAFSFSLPVLGAGDRCRMKRLIKVGAAGSGRSLGLDRGVRRGTRGKLEGRAQLAHMVYHS